jgi:hypothetical protein
MGDTNYHKIGISNNDPQARLSGLQVSSPFELHFIAAYYAHSPVPIERALHKALAYCRIRGEWFQDTNGDVIKIFHEYGSMALFDAALNTDDDDERIAIVLEQRRVAARTAVFVAGQMGCKDCGSIVAFSTPSEKGVLTRLGCVDCRTKRKAKKEVS